MKDPVALIDEYMDDSLSTERAEQMRLWLSEADANADLFAREVFFHRRLHDILRGQGILDIEEQVDEAGRDTDPRGRSMVIPAIKEPAESDAGQPASPAIVPRRHARGNSAITREKSHAARLRFLFGWRAAGAGLATALAACLVLALLLRPRRLRT